MNSQSTSFIPQRPTPGKIKNRGVRKVYILTYVSYVLFFGTLIAAAGTFFFTFTLESQLAGLRQELALEKDRFSQSDIESVRELDQRISIAKARMNQHISIPSILEALEQNAIQSLQFIGFSYARSNDLAPVVTVAGRTENFDSVLFQREVLASNPVLADSRFSETSLVTSEADSETGTAAQKVITFVFAKTIDPETVGYVPRQNTGDTSIETSSVESETIISDETTETSSEDTEVDSVPSESVQGSEN